MVRELPPTDGGPMAIIAIITTPRAIIICAIAAMRRRADVAARAIAVSERPVSTVKAPVVPVRIVM
jgi:hypothetical protein